MRAGGSSKNVGIGTTNPSAKLEVAGLGNQKLLVNRTDGDNFFIDAQNGQIRLRGSSNIIMGVGADVLTVTDSNVGIGTTSPISKLHLGGAIGGLSTGITFGDGDTGIWEASDDNLRFSTSSSTRMVVTSSGNIGIGTTSPDYKLDVNGDARLSGAFYDSNNLPGTAGKVLSSTGAATSWIEPSSVITRLIPYFQTATPGGSDTYTQSNNVVDFDWSGGSGTYEYILPSATAIPYRTIRFVNNSTITASDKIHITAPSGETIDGGAFYEINKPYNGCAVWSDGVEWIVIQAKA